MSSPPRVIWTTHATKRLKQRFNAEPRDMSKHAETIATGAKFFDGRPAQVKIGQMYFECKWVNESGGVAVIMTVHKKLKAGLGSADNVRGDRARAARIARRKIRNETITRGDA